jgi:hypothetical protein
MATYSFNVTLNGQWIDRVWHTFSASHTIAEMCEEVRSGLVNHDGYDPCIKVTFPRGQRVTETYFHVEGRYSCGWEVVNVETTWKDARRSLREYRENEPGTPFRLVPRMVRKP